MSQIVFAQEVEFQNIKGNIVLCTVPEEGFFILEFRAEGVSSQDEATEAWLLSQTTSLDYNEGQLSVLLNEGDQLSFLCPDMDVAERMRKALLTPQQAGGIQDVVDIIMDNMAKAQHAATVMVPLDKMLSPSFLSELLNDDEALSELQTHLPPSLTGTDCVAHTLRSVQLHETIRTFSAGLYTSELLVLFSALGLPKVTTDNDGVPLQDATLAFCIALEKKHTRDEFVPGTAPAPADNTTENSQ